MTAGSVAEGVREEVASFGPHASLSGVLSIPASPPSGSGPPAVILLNAGATHRIGPARLYVRLARALARRGFLVLRFDHSGLGDSAPRGDGVPYAESLLLEVGEALDFLARSRGVARFVLGGICSGGATAFVVARRDPRVVGALVINAQGHFHADHPERVEAAQRRALSRHSLRIGLASSFRRKSWRKLLSGRLGLRRAAAMLLAGPSRLLKPRPVSAPADAADSGPDVRADLAELERRGVRVLHLYSEGDEGLDYYRLMLGRSAREGDGFRFLKGVDHLFTQRWAQDELVEVVLQWASELGGAATRSRSSSSPGERDQGF